MRLSGSYAIYQIVYQLASFATSILIVRSIGKEDYGLYSITLAMVAAVTVVSDAGISSVLMVDGARLSNNPEEFKRLFLQGVRYKQRFGAALIACGAAWGAVLFTTIGVDAARACLLIAGFIMLSGPVLTIGVLQIAMRMRLDAVGMQRIVTVVALFRMLVCGALAIAVDLTLFILVTISVLSTVLTYLWSRRRAGIVGARSVNLSQQQKGRFSSALVRTMPITGALVIVEQSSTALISHGAGPEVVGEVAALSRYSIAFVLLNSFILDLMLPRLAKFTGGHKETGRRYLLITLIYVLAICLFGLGVFISAPVLLSVLGPSYVGLKVALVQVSFAYGLTHLGHMMNSLNASLGWIGHSWIYFPLALAWGVWGTLFYEINDVGDAAILLLAAGTIIVASQSVRAYAGWRISAAAGRL